MESAIVNAYRVPVSLFTPNLETGRFHHGAQGACEDRRPVAMPDMTGTVVAVIDDRDKAREALIALATAGFGAELLYGEEGRILLGKASEDGITSVMRRLVLDFGDGAKVVDLMDEALAGGAYITSVDIEADQVREVTLILAEHGGHDMWRLGEMSHDPLRVGEPVS
jgi:hypothetical protein